MPYLDLVPPVPDEPEDSRAGAPPSAEVTRREVLPADPAAVWAALTDPDRLGSWWGEGTVLDPAPGGAGRFVDPDGSVREGMVVEATPGRRLRLDWWPEDGDEPASRVTIDLEPAPDGSTVLTVTEAVLRDLVVHPAVFLRGTGPAGPLGRVAVVPPGRLLAHC
jgi:uncharacterized protein YndB with AHSA1/START domain